MLVVKPFLLSFTLRCPTFSLRLHDGSASDLWKIKAKNKTVLLLKNAKLDAILLYFAVLSVE